MIQAEMLQYQSIDRELNRIEKELRKNEFFVKRKQYKQLHQNCEDSITKSEGKAADLRNQLAAARQSMAQIVAVLDEYYKEIEEVEGEDELNYMSKKLNEQLDLLAAVERDIKRITHEGEEIVKSLDDINGKLPKIVSLYAKCNDEFNKVAETAKPRINELRQKQTALKGKIDPKLLEIYQKVAAVDNRPVFVPLRDGVRCGCCQMEMPKAVVDAQFAGRDFIRCEHCGHLIYREQ